MAVSDTASETLRVRCTDTVPADADARHVDQLADSTYLTVARVVDDGPVELDAASTRLSAGDVVVYIEYLRVERA